MKPQPVVAVTWPSRLEHVAEEALKFLLAQAGDGFSEARHVMRFPRRLGFSGDSEVHAGDVFQRAVIVDALLDARESLSCDLDDLIKVEVDYLMSCRRDAKLGVWSYFPDLLELPADADTLGQMFRVLKRTGRFAELRHVCEPALTVLLSDCAHNDGSVESWILPNERGPDQVIQARFVEQAWGRGPDCEVMANLLDALLDYAPDRHAESVSKAVRFIELQQQPNGAWLSTWYCGPYYGTYVCSRLIKKMIPGSPAIGMAVDFVRRNQAADGGWGVGLKSDLLSASLAMLCLASLREGEPTPADAAMESRSLDFLEASLDCANPWMRVPYIKMSVGRAVGKSGPEILYGSATITAAFCLKAALAWQRLTRLRAAGRAASQ